MGGEPLTVEQLGELSRLPARDVLHAQLVAMVASPITGLVRGLNALIAGLAIQLGQIVEQGLLPAGEAPARGARCGGAGGGGPAEETGAEETPRSEETPAAEDTSAEEPAAEAEPEEEQAEQTEAPSEGEEQKEG